MAKAFQIERLPFKELSHVIVEFLVSSVAEGEPRRYMRGFQMVTGGNAEALFGRENGGVWKPYQQLFSVPRLIGQEFSAKTVV